MGLVASLVGGLANGDHEVDARHPLIVGELCFACKVVDVTDQGPEQFAVPVRDVGAHGLDNILCEAGIEAMRPICAVGSHDVRLSEVA